MSETATTSTRTRAPRAAGTITVTLDEGNAKRLRERATQNDRTVQAEANRVLRYALDGGTAPDHPKDAISQKPF